MSLSRIPVIARQGASGARSLVAVLTHAAIADLSHLEGSSVQRLWHSLNYECVYLSEFATGSEARAGIGWRIG